MGITELSAALVDVEPSSGSLCRLHSGNIALTSKSSRVPRTFASTLIANSKSCARLAMCDVSASEYVVSDTETDFDLGSTCLTRDHMRLANELGTDNTKEREFR